MRLLGLCSTYKEGSLCVGAIRSLLRACDDVIVFEGPAGTRLSDDVPDSELNIEFLYPRPAVHRGVWRTDARKRQAMLDYARGHCATWGVIVDGDEVLCNAEYLRDWLQVLDWEEEQGAEPYLGRPLRLVEMNGAIGWLRGRLLRLDRVHKYEISTSVFVDSEGNLRGEGNTADSFRRLWNERGVRIDGELVRDDKGGEPVPVFVPLHEDSQVFTGPPMPCEPFILHRSLLRHPLRRGLRMHEQEREELDRAGLMPDA